MNEHTKPSCPAQILEWIAWYPDGGLSDAQRAAVEVHAAGCAACREELAILAERAETATAPEDPELLFERVLARVEASGVEAVRNVLPSGSSRAGADPTRRAPASRRRTHAGRRRAAIVAAGFVLVALAGALGWLGRDWTSLVDHADAEEGYRTAAEVEPTTQSGVGLEVVFRDEASAIEINTLLRALGATVTTGPTELGRYRLLLPPGSDARAAAALLRADEAGVASYAEPVRP
jgi:anti-sigma factor RsiW